jgi:hypothetical protein
MHGEKIKVTAFSVYRGGELFLLFSCVYWCSVCFISVLTVALCPYECVLHLVVSVRNIK